MKVAERKRKLSEYEIYLISGLAHGCTVGELPVILKFYAMDANSISSIDKNLHKLRKDLGCRTNAQLVYTFSRQVVKLNIQKVLN